MKITFQNNRVIWEAETKSDKKYLTSIAGDFFANKNPESGNGNGNGTKKHKKHIFKKPCPVCGKEFKGVVTHMKWKHPEEYSKL
jgi:hypothetical protein